MSICGTSFGDGALLKGCSCSLCHRHVKCDIGGTPQCSEVVSMLALNGSQFGVQRRVGAAHCRIQSQELDIGRGDRVSFRFRGLNFLRFRA